MSIEIKNTNFLALKRQEKYHKFEWWRSDDPKLPRSDAPKVPRSDAPTSHVPK